MKPAGPNPNKPQKSLYECNTMSGMSRSENIDPPQPYCPPDDTQPNQNTVNGVDLSWLEDELINKKTGHGHAALCDPMQAGQIINDLDNPQHNTIYRYSKSLRGCDEAVQDLFRTIVILDEDGDPHPVPIIWATQERAVAAVVQENFRKDETNVVDRIRFIFTKVFLYNC